MRYAILLAIVLACVSNAQARIEFLDGGSYDIDYLIDDSILVAGTTVNLLPGGEITGRVYLETWSGFFNMYGGTVGGTLCGSGVLCPYPPIANIYGGVLNADTAIYGYAGSPAIFNIYGDGFNYPYGPVPDNNGTITGVLSNGDPFSWYFNLANSHATIVLQRMSPTVVPAPGAILLGTLGTGLVDWLRRRRTL